MSLTRAVVATLAAPAEPDATGDDALRPGTLAGDYLIEAPAGCGGFSSVYRASGPDGRPVAIKVLRRELSASPRILERFAREARALARLDHPGIVALREVGALLDGRPYLVMDWLDGTTLADELGAAGRLSLAEVMALGGDVAAALAAAHRAGVIHRDLKTSNVVLVPGPDRRRAVVVDFGIAKLLETDGDPDGAAGPLTTGTPLGTPLVMSPEQIRGEPVDGRTDVYALGVMLFAMATGQPPFDSKTPLGLIDAHLTAPPPRPSDRAPVPRELDELVLSCLAKDPVDRPGSAEEVARALAGLATGGGTSAPSPAGGAGGLQQAVAIYAVVVPAGPGAGDLAGAADAADALSTALEAAGLVRAWEDGAAVLAVALGGAEVCRRVIDLARALAGPDRAIWVHAGPVECEAGRPVGGELLVPGGWTGPVRGGALSISAAASAAAGTPLSVASRAA